MTTNSNKVGAHGEKAASFEENFARLQEVVGRLSAGNLSLQEALAAFEEGMALTDRCSHMLEEAELRVKQVSDRTMRAGSASLVELDEVMRGVPQGSGIGDQGLGRLKPNGDAFMVEIETTFVQGSGIRDQGSGVRSREAPDKTPSATNKNKSQPARPQAQPLLDELDPLFDDE